VSRACKLTSLPRKMYYYKSQREETVVIEALQELTFINPHMDSISSFPISEDRVMNGTIKKSIGCTNY
jgi:hypothetical protein